MLNAHSGVIQQANATSNHHFRVQGRPSTLPMRLNENKIRPFISLLTRAIRSVKKKLAIDLIARLFLSFTRTLGFLGIAVSSSAAIDMASAINRALEQSPLVQAAEQQVAAARATWYQASRRPNPLAELRGENWRITPELQAHDPDLDFFATLSQLVELGGKRAARQAIAFAGIDLARERARTVRQQVAIETARQFLAVVRTRQELDAIAESAKSIESLRDIVRRRVSEGRAAEAEQLKLEAELGRLRVLAAEGAANQFFALEQIRQLTADPALTAETLSAPELASPPVGNDLDLVDQALRRHPEYQMVLAEKNRAQRSFDLERARRIPDPALTAGYKRTAARDTLVAGVLVPVPLFDTNWGNVQRATAELMAASAQLEATVLRLRAELLSLLQRWRTLALRAFAARNDLVGPAASVRQATRAAFAEGAGEILSVVDAERVYLEARRSALAIWADAVLAAQTWNVINQEEDK